MEFVRKGADMASITGEKLHVNQAIEAVRRAARTLELPVQQFCLQADVDSSRYELLLEFPAPAPAPAAVARLAQAIDGYLGELNVEYRAKRDSGRLHGPRALVMQPGWAERRARRQAAQGGRDVQAKPRLLTTMREMPPDDEVLFAVG